MDIPIEVMDTTLKHLAVRRQNFYRSIETNPEDTRVDHWNREIDFLNEAIEWFQELRDENRHGGDT